MEDERGDRRVILLEEDAAHTSHGHLDGDSLSMCCGTMSAKDRIAVLTVYGATTTHLNLAFLLTLKNVCAASASDLER